MASPETDTLRQQLSALFTALMRRLHISQEGANLNISILETDEAQDFITTHASILDSSFQQVSLSDTMRQALQRSDYIFSGIKTFHELNEAFPSLVDANGERKPFEKFLNDVRKIDETYNKNYLHAEYNFCQQSANMAAKWDQFQQDYDEYGDRYLLQYRTAGDSHVRPAHAALDDITLSVSHPFWQQYFPPNGWNCRCTVEQVRAAKYPATPDSEVQHLVEQNDSQNPREAFFRFNPGVERKSFPDYNPYTIRRCRDCDIAKGKINLAFLPSNMLCDGCRFIHGCYEDRAKSESKVLKTHYMHQMEPLLATRQAMPTRESDKSISVGFTKIGNEHLYSDTFGRSKVLRKEDLKALDQLLTRATYIDDKELAEGEHKYNIVHFYYYQVNLHGQKVRLNVAKERRTRKNGQIKIRHYLYSINDIKE